MTRELSDDARSLIRAAVSEEPRPDRAHRARLRRQLQVRAAAGGALTFAGASVAKAAGGASVLSTVTSFVGLGFGAGLVLAGAAQVALGPSAAPVPNDRPSVSAPHARGSHAEAATLPTAPAGVESVASGVPEPPELKRIDDEAALELASGKARAVSGATAPVASAAPNSSLRAELDLMAQVQGALRDGQAARALELIARYDLRYPSGSLSNERQAAEVFAACAIGDSARARRAAAIFLAHDNVSALAGRVKKACFASIDGAP
jgi:hypothetical protein